ncbi:heme-binding Shp domain-containing protein [Erysipelotrichaceae bacterium HCN-30851]
MRIKKVLIIAAFLFLSVLQIQPIQAFDDGAYLIGCSSSYANPLTNETVDGGTNIALGDSMVASIVEKQLLLEQVDGKMYLTIGLGLSSQVSNVRFQLMDASGNMISRSAEITGSSQANGDTVNHYRIQIDSLTQYISPIMYVTPMGRDVQFFITLNSSAISAGTGIYNSLMIPQETPFASKEETQTSEVSGETEVSSKQETEQTESAKEQDSKEKQETASKDDAELTTLTKESLLEGVEGMTYYEAASQKAFSWIPLAVVGAGMIIAGGLLYVKKIKK